jgi:hypothetical protein
MYSSISIRIPEVRENGKALVPVVGTGEQHRLWDTTTLETWPQEA